MVGGQDKYILTSMGILCGVCVWHATVPLFVVYGVDTARTIDKCGLIISASTYFLFHVCFFLYIYFVVSRLTTTAHFYFTSRKHNNNNGH